MGLKMDRGGVQQVTEITPQKEENASDGCRNSSGKNLTLTKKKAISKCGRGN